MYSQIVWDHFRSPRNRGEMSDPTVVGSGNYVRCGDYFDLYLKLEHGQISQATFEAHACAPVVAMGSVGTELLRGLTLTQARAISVYDLDQAMGGLPGPKRHAILLFLQALSQALNSLESEINQNGRL